MTQGMATQVTKFAFAAGFALAAGTGFATTAKAEGVLGVQNRSIAYVMVYENRAIYRAADVKTQCPDGLNDGPSAQFKKLWPEGTHRTVIGTRLQRESDLWHPTTDAEPLPYYEVQGKIGLGLDLDGRNDENDYMNPDGEKGIDNQMYRALGCTFNYREGQTSILTPQWRRNTYNRYVIELTDVDSLENDDDVTVTTYRGMDPLITDATGEEYLSGGTQALDMRWGKRYIQTFKGKINDGVLTTEAKDLLIPSASVYAPRDGAPDILYRDMRFKLNVTDSQANGLMGGYADIWTWYYHSHKTRDARHQDYGGTSGPSQYKSLMRNADAYPDPKTGQNTAISAALDVRFVHVFIQRPDAQVAEGASETQTAANGEGAVDARSRE